MYSNTFVSRESGVESVPNYLSYDGIKLRLQFSIEISQIFIFGITIIHFLFISISKNCQCIEDSQWISN